MKISGKKLGCAEHRLAYYVLTAAAGKKAV